MRLLVFSLVLGTLQVLTSAQAQELPDYMDETSSFILQINGLGEAEGEVRIAMFDSEEKYTKEPVYAVVLPADSTTINWQINALPFGKYAIAVYHDKNTNGKLDTNMLGIPKERYGFSNNARGRFGPASWDDSAFEVVHTEFVHEIMIK
ncbi:MAG: DUF2141 domain-containing protein [Balneolales bacterium]|nr:DUF2141 domain-containing protein [Balneolales bacterium]